MLQNLKLGAKIGMGFGLVLLIAAGIGIFATVSMQQIRGDSEALAEGYVPEWVLAGEIADRMHRAGYYAVAYSINYDPVWLQNARTQVSELSEVLRTGRASAGGAFISRIFCRSLTIWTQPSPGIGLPSIKRKPRLPGFAPHGRRYGGREHSLKNRSRPTWNHKPPTCFGRLLREIPGMN